MALILDNHIPFGQSLALLRCRAKLKSACRCPGTGRCWAISTHRVNETCVHISSKKDEITPTSQVTVQFVLLILLKTPYFQLSKKKLSCFKYQTLIANMGFNADAYGFINIDYTVRICSIISKPHAVNIL